MPSPTPRPRRALPLAGVLALAMVTLAIGFAHKRPCHDGVPVEGEPWAHACYSDILPLYGGRGLADGLWPYLQADLEYPVLTGALMAAVGLPVNALGGRGLLGGADEGLVFFWATAAVLVVLALVTVAAVALMRRDRPGDAVLLALAPGLAIGAGINWDLLAVALTTLALLAWQRRSPVAAGVLLGLAAAAKFYPLLVLGPLVLLCLRAGTPAGRRAAGVVTGSAAAAWATVNLPVALAAPQGWARFYRFSSERGADWGSLWFVGDNLPLGWTPLGPAFDRLVGDVGLLNAAAQASFLACCAGIAALIWFAPTTPRLASVAFLVVAAFLLTNKVWSPQFVLWLLPLAVLARPRWQWFLVWQAVEVAYAVSVFRVFLDEAGSGPALVQAALGRWLAVAVLAGLVVAEALRPGLDVVRGGDGRTPGPDPDAGVLAGGVPFPPPEPPPDPAPEPPATAGAGGRTP
ncbi:MAG: glycosyltransferase family 87 protein [Kineosporiaceae bacterium]